MHTKDLEIIYKLVAFYFVVLFQISGSLWSTLGSRASCYSYPYWGHTVYPKKYAHGFVVLCFVVVMQSFIMNSREVFIHIHQGCFAGTGAIVRLPQCQWSKPDGYGKISQCITTTKQKPCAYFLGYTVMTETLLDPGEVLVELNAYAFGIIAGIQFTTNLRLHPWIGRVSSNRRVQMDGLLYFSGGTVFRWYQSFTISSLQKNHIVGPQHG